eukprot:4994708-Amphidinium_carterae.1
MVRPTQGVTVPATPQGRGKRGRAGASHCPTSHDLSPLGRVAEAAHPRVASIISEATGLEVTAVDELEAGDLASFDGLIVGCPTWNTGLSLSGKLVAVFGCGDSQAYGDNFCDGIEELHETFKAAGAKNI